VKEIDESVTRLLEFVESKGGIAKVARQIGKSTQLFYNYRNGLSEPTRKVFVSIKEFYPDLDINYIFFGESVSSNERIELFEKKIEELTKDNITLMKSLLKEKGVGFT